MALIFHMTSETRDFDEHIFTFYRLNDLLMTMKNAAVSLEVK